MTLAPVVARWFPVILFWSLPMIVPTAFALRLIWERPVPDAEAGYSWLSLPAGIATQALPLDGWSKLERRTTSPEPVVHYTQPPAPSPETPKAAPFFVELHGHAGEGGSAVYCFFDTLDGSWFRMSPGDVDRDRQLALESGEAGILRLVDLSNGDRYRIQPGERKPELLDVHN